MSYIDKNQPWFYMYSPFWSPLPHPSQPDPSGSSQRTRSEHLSHASNLGWWSVSPLIIYMFRCCSLETSHPRLLPQSLKVCSVHLCLFFCFLTFVDLFFCPVFYSNVYCFLLLITLGIVSSLFSGSGDVMLGCFLRSLFLI